MKPYYPAQFDKYMKSIKYGYIIFDAEIPPCDFNKICMCMVLCDVSYMYMFYFSCALLSYVYWLNMFPSLLHQ